MPTSMSAPPPARSRFRRHCVGIADGEAEVGVDDLDVAEHLLARQPHALEVVGLELAAIAHAQHLAGLLAGVDHLLAALDGDLQRLFAEHVFAGGRGGERVFQVQRVRRHHVDDVDVLVVAICVHGLVVVDALVGQAVLLLPFLGLRRRAGDDAGEAAVARLQQRRRDLVGREAAEAAQRDAELARRRLSDALPRLAEQRRGGERGGSV